MPVSASFFPPFSLSSFKTFLSCLIFSRTASRAKLVMLGQYFSSLISFLMASTISLGKEIVVYFDEPQICN